MPGYTDQILTRLAGEVEERQTFIDGIVEGAETEKRDLTEQELALMTRARDRVDALNAQIDPLKDAARIGVESRERTAEIASLFAGRTSPAAGVEYRTAGEYILDVWQAGLGVEDAARRLDLFKRAAAHQTTGDNPGLLPAAMVQPVINFIDASRPLVDAFGPRQLPAGSFSRPRITQHTNVAPQTAEKTELVSRKMTIGSLPVVTQTFGGYVNVSRQNIDWSQPGIMDLIISDLAAVYAQETEKAFATALDAASTAGPVIPTGPTTPAAVAAAIWTAVGVSYAALKGAGRTVVAVSPDMLGLVGPLFAPVNPSNAHGDGFNAAAFASGAQGNISGLQVVMTPGLDAGSILVVNTAAAEVYEDRIGALQVVEPSVLGVQVAYAGYFANLVIDAAGIVEITKTP